MIEPIAPEKSIFKKEREILSSSEEVVRKIEAVLHSENTSKEDLMREYLILSEQYKKLLKVSNKITHIGDMNQRKLFDAYEITQVQSVEIEQKNQALYQLSITDILTRQFNRRYLLEFFSKEFSKTKRHGFNLSCIMIDIDHFKHVNDSFGHQCGDIILEKSAEIIKNNLRNDDVFGRYGGEEFLVILPNTSSEEACVVAEKIRLAIELNTFITAQGPVNITLSCGITDILCEAPLHVDAMINNADMALYAAKDSGRNTTTLFDPSMTRI